MEWRGKCMNGSMERGRWAPHLSMQGSCTCQGPFTVCWSWQTPPQNSVFKNIVWLKKLSLLKYRGNELYWNQNIKRDCDIITSHRWAYLLHPLDLFFVCPSNQTSCAPHHLPLCFEGYVRLPMPEPLWGSEMQSSLLWGFSHYWFRV